MASQFEDRLNNLRVSAAKAGAPIQGSARALWSTLLGEDPEDIVDSFDNDEIIEKFNRSHEAKEYLEAVDKSSSFRSAQQAKIQSDTLAAMERDTRMRHRSRVRMMAHSAAKLNTHGLPDGPTGRAILFVNRLKEQTDGSDN